MYGGEVTVNQRTAKIIRTTGLFMPVLLVGYGVLIQYNVLDNSHFLNSTVFYIGMAVWTLIGIAQYLWPVKHQSGAAFYLISYHLLGMLYILFVAGFSTPFTPAWAILFLAAYAYFSNKGLLASILALVLTTAVDIALGGVHSFLVATNLLTLFGVLSIGLTAVAIGRVQEIDGAELTKSKALETLQRDRILTIVNNLADAVMSTDEDGIIRVYNAASLNLLDTNTSLNGHHIDDVITLYDKNSKPISFFKDLKKSRSVVVRDDLTFSLEGEALRLEVTYSPIRSGYMQSRKRASSNDGYIVILRDITKAKSLEEERDEFISVVSHELRTPITIAEGTISNVQIMMDRPEISSDILKQSIETAHDQVIYLSKMVNDLSTLSRAERGVADAPESITVRDLVGDLYHEYAPQAEAKKLHFNLDLDSHLGHISASRLYLKELLQNFITNAIKYTKEGSITLKVSRKNEALTFEVHDTGIGISKSDQAKIFNKFYRSEDYRTRETSGTGLGLYVAAKLAKKLGIKIELHSRLNHGSTFSFSLPTEEVKRNKPTLHPEA